MKRGFLLGRGANVLSVQPPPDPVPPASSSKATALAATGRQPRIFCADARLPIAISPHFLYPTTDMSIVLVDTLDRLREHSQWPIWSQPAPNPFADAPFEIVHIAGRGKAMIARRHIAKGDLICVERPVYATRAELMWSSDFTKINGRPYLAPFAGLNNASQAAITALSSAPGVPGHSLATIFHTNNLELDVTHDVDPNPTNRYVGCFPTLARVNHSCRPSANYYFVFDNFCGEIRAMRDLKPGDEVTISYVGMLQTREARQARLQSLWRFQCACEACDVDEATQKQSNVRRKRLAELFNRLESPELASQPNAAPTLGQLQAGIEMLGAEGLVAKRAGLIWLGSACLFVRGDFVNAFDWVKRARDEHLLVEGEHSATAAKAEDLIPDFD